MRRAKQGFAGFAVRLMLAASARTYGAQRRCWLALILGFVCHHGFAQNDPLMATCNEPVKAPFCFGHRGDRADGWLEQGRSEVMAQHGMVVTSQPLAAQVGLQIRVAGFYRAGSDHRKDGAAVGW